MNTINEWLFEGYGDEILRGLTLTVSVAVGALALAIVLGMLAARAKLAPSRVARGAASLYTTVVRGIPELVLILVLYYGFPTLVQSMLAQVAPDYRLNFNPYVTGVCVLGTIYGAFLTEVFRAAFLAVPRGELEAATAFGMTPRQVFWRIHLPQMWRYALPGLGNVWMVLVKATALVSVIQLQEMMYWAKRAGEATHQPFKFLLLAMVLYLAITFVSEQFFAAAERRAARGVRRA